MRKVCVTVIFGDYDELKEPTVVNKDWKYILISDRHHKSEVWKTKIFKNKELTDKRKTSYVITQIHKLIDYDVCIIIGAQTEIKCNLDKYVTDDNFTLLEHPSRNCIYDEGYACILLDKDDPKKIANHLYRYSLVGFPKGAGMIRTGLTIRRKVKEVNEFCDRWWHEIFNGSHRDQLSFNYVNWKTPIEYKLIKHSQWIVDFKVNKHK